MSGTAEPDGAAHGGVLPLIFDETMGRLANTGCAQARPELRPRTLAGPGLRPG